MGFVLMAMDFLNSFALENTIDLEFFKRTTKHLWVVGEQNWKQKKKSFRR